ncbi:hypothetical protein H5410_036169 [Solanum commersonii]|uniref:Uncharacterized protein n=1 Tax=Solanum commersonii TaxID=4109 RepID=A0A9J5Y3E8_SOLCO|nr:hypothetical protein H5410_036169 [Solanum commersonii]
MAYSNVFIQRPFSKASNLRTVVNEGNYTVSYGFYTKIKGQDCMNKAENKQNTITNDMKN